MAVDDEIVLEAKAASFSQSRLNRVVELVLAASEEDVVNGFDRRCRGFDPGAALFDYARALVSSLGSAARSWDAGAGENVPELLLRVILKLLEVIHSGILSNDAKSCMECVSVVAQEVQSLTPRAVVSVVDSVLKNLRSESPEEGCFTLELLPTCMRLVVRATDVVISADGEEEEVVSGEEYVDKVVDWFVAMKWFNTLLTKMASLIRELPLETSQTERLLQKIVTGMKSLEPQDLPALVYQLLLLASKGFKGVALDGIINFFSKLQSKSQESRNDVVDQVVGTVILHINFAVRQDPSLGQELLNTMRNSSRAPSPFMMSVLLSVARLPRFEQPCLEFLKATIVAAYRNNQHCRDSKWAFNVAGEECLQRKATVEQSLMKTVNCSAYGWEHVAPSVVKLGFLLMETKNAKSVAGDSRGWDQLSGAQILGLDVLVTAFNVHDIARDEIIEESKYKIIGLKPQQSYPVFRMIGKLISSRPLLMLDYATRLKECLDYFTLLNPMSARLLIQTISPLYQMNGDLQDYTMLVLRKAMFSRDITVRATAVQGLLDLLHVKTYKAVDSLNLSEASCSQSSQRFPESSVKLLNELVGLFRRCLSQQSIIREALYRGLPKLAAAGSESTEIIFDLLWPHFNQFYEASEDSKGHIKLDCCMTRKCETVQVDEPVDQLLFCVHRLLALLPEEDGKSDDPWTSLSQGKSFVQVSTRKSLSAALLNLRTGMQSASLASLGLDKPQIDLEMTEKGRLILGVLEVLVNFATSEKSDMKDQTWKEITAYISLWDLISEKLGKKHGKTKAGPDSPEDTGPAVPQASFDKRKPLFSLTCMACLIEAVLQSSDIQSGRLTDSDMKVLRLTFSASSKVLSSATSEDMEDLPEDDLKQLCRPLLRFIFQHKAVQVPTQAKGKGKETGGKRTANLMLAGLKTLDVLLRLADRRNCIHVVVTGMGDEDDMETEAEESIEDARFKLVDKFLSELQPLLLEMLSTGRHSEVELLAGTFLLLASKLPLPLLKPHNVWAHELCQKQTCANPAAARSVANLALSLSVPPFDVEVGNCMASELLKVMGTDETDPAPASERYAMISSKTKLAFASLLLQQVDAMLTDADWLVSVMKSQAKAMHSLDRVKQEESLHARVEGLVSILSKFMTMNLADSTSEHAIKVVVKLYKNLASVARLCIAPKGVKQSVPSPKFQKLAEATCKSLTRPLYTFVAMMQRERQENLNVKGAASKIKREGKTIPDLVFYIEDYEKNLIQLSKVTKVNLMRHAKRSTARDFKIIDNAPAEEQQVDDTGSEDDDAEDGTGAGDEDEDERAKRAKRTQEDDNPSTPKRQRT